MRLFWAVILILSFQLPAWGEAPLEIQQPIPADIGILPEVATPVEMSASDANRIVCAGVIEDIVFSKEKGLSVHYTRKDAFLKFQIIKENDRLIYAETPAEVFVVCKESVYRIIAIPKRIPSQTVRLLAGRSDQIKTNRSLMNGLPLEEKVITLVKWVYTDAIPESLTVKRSQERFDLFRDIDLTLIRTVTVEGEGLTVREFLAKATSVRVELKEKDFLRAELARKPVAITVDRFTLSAGQSARIFIVEQGGIDD